MQLNARWLKWQRRRLQPALGGSLQCDKSGINSANGANLILKLHYTIAIANIVVHQPGITFRRGTKEGRDAMVMG